MVTKGVIKSIDLLGNTCTVHIPFFETASNDPIVETATVSNTPGSYNGYKVGDVVYVAFENGSMSNPVIVGKLYLGTEKEKAEPRGVLNVEESSAAKKATLPADAKLAVDLDPNVPNTTVPYSSLSSIANELNKLNTEVAQNDRDYGNRFKQVSTNIDGVSSELLQTATEIRASVKSTKETLEGAIQENSAAIQIEADKIAAEVTARKESINGVIEEYKSAIEQTATDINAKVVHKIEDRAGEESKEIGEKTDPVTGETIKLTSKGLGWKIDENEWTVKAYDQQEKNGENMLPEDGLDLFKITRSKVEINVPELKLAGYPRVTTVRYAYGSASYHPKLYKEGVTGPTLDTGSINLEESGEGGWTLTEPPYEPDKDTSSNMHSIWQWTQTAKYEYSEGTELWEETITDDVKRLTINTNLSNVYQKTNALSGNISTLQANYTTLNNTVSTFQASTNTNISNTLYVANGKTNTYYGSTNPATSITVFSVREQSTSNPIVIKQGDFWFCTGTLAYTYKEQDDIPTSELDYLGKYVSPNNADEPYLLVTDENMEAFLNGKGPMKIIPGETPVFTMNVCEEEIPFVGGILYQWVGNPSDDLTNPGRWEDISAELVANKVTANYINALDITAKKVTVIDNKNTGILFEANGLNTNPTGDTNYVKIAGFNVEANTLTTGSTTDGNLIKLNSDSNSQYSFYGLTQEEYLTFAASLEYDPNDPKSGSVKAFEKSDSLWVYKGPSDTEEKHYLAFSANNISAKDFEYAITKIIFNQKVEKPFTFYIRDTSAESQDYVIVSTLNADTIPAYSAAGKVQAYTHGQGNKLMAVTFNPAGTIAKDSYFYIVYRHRSGNNTNSAYKGQVYLPVDIRMTIGDNFQVLADGSVYANNVFLGGVTKEPVTNSGPDSLPDTEDVETSSNSGGTLAAVKIISGGEGKKTSLDDDLPGVYLGPDGISIGTGFKVEANGSPVITNVQLTEEQKAELKLKYEDLTAEQKEELKGEAGVGTPGRSVLSTVKYYKLATSTPTAPSNSTGTPSGWSTSPPTFESGKNYYETTRTQYDTADSSGYYYSWSTPVKNSMLTVDFINSLGITAEKIDVGDTFSADADTETVTIGGFNVTAGSIYSSNQKLYLGSDGILYATDANLQGEIRATGGKIGAFNITAYGLESDEHIKLTSESIYFPTQTVFNLANDVTIHNDTACSYLVTGGDRHFEIKNKGGAGIRFNANKIESNIIQQINLSAFKITVDSESEDLGEGYTSTSYFHYLDINWSISNNGVLLSPEVITIYLRYNYDYPGGAYGAGAYNEDYEKTVSLTIPALTNSGSFHYDLGLGGKPENYTFYGWRKVYSTNNSDFHKNALSFDTVAVNETNNILYSLGHFCPNVPTGGSEYTSYVLGDDDHVWKGLRIETSPSIGSDRRIKNNITAVSNKYDSFFDGLKPSTFRYNTGESGRTHLGFIAQEVEESLIAANLSTIDFAGLCIGKNETQTYALRYDEFIALNTDQIQKLKKRVADQEARITELEEAIKKLKTE